MAVRATFPPPPSSCTRISIRPQNTEAAEDEDDDDDLLKLGDEEFNELRDRVVNATRKRLANSRLHVVLTYDNTTFVLDDIPANTLIGALKTAVEVRFPLSLL